MKKSKVSVIIPVYNKETYLKECLESVLLQTLKEIEIICIDDGSTDRSSDILRMFQDRDSRIKIITHSQNKGIIQARKTALIEAQGDFISFVDADDLAEPNMCEELYEKAVSKNADFVQCNAEVYDPENILQPDIFNMYNRDLNNGKAATLEGKEIFQNLHQQIRVNLFLSLYKISVYKEVIPFITKNAPKRGDDDLLSFLFSYFSSKYVFLDKILYKYRANESSSNVNRISYEIAKSQIVGRAAVIQYAKSFVRKVNGNWDITERPFSFFSYALTKYAANFIERYVQDGGTRKNKLVQLFCDTFESDTNLFMIKRLEDLEVIIQEQNIFMNELTTSNNVELALQNLNLKRELLNVYSSRTWKLAKPARWCISKFRERRKNH